MGFAPLASTAWPPRQTRPGRSGNWLAFQHLPGSAV